MSEPHLTLVAVFVLVPLLFVVERVHHRCAGVGRTHRAHHKAQPEPHLSVSARSRTGKGAELAVDVAARGLPAIAAVMVLAAAITVCVMMRLVG